MWYTQLGSMGIALTIRFKCVSNMFQMHFIMYFKCVPNVFWHLIKRVLTRLIRECVVLFVL